MQSSVTNEEANVKWVVEALKNRTATWVTDRSFFKKTTPTRCGTGWVIYCTSCEKRVCGNFVESSTHAGSYRAELLGLLAIHTMVAAIEQFCIITVASAKICCNNQRALFKSKEYRCGIPTGSSQADIKQALCNIKTMLKTTFDLK